MTQVILFSLEEIDTRYTKQWAKYFPICIENFCIKNNIEVDLISIPGDTIEGTTTKGAFLNFSLTNIYKNTQINYFLKFVNDNKIKKGAKLIFPDAWHPGIIQCKYVSDLLNLEFEIYSIWHAGSYDPQDFLGRLIKDKRWSYNAERSYFYSSKKNFFATNFHYNLISSKLEFNYRENDLRSISGFGLQLSFCGQWRRRAQAMERLGMVYPVDHGDGLACLLECDDV